MVLFGYIGKIGNIQDIRILGDTLFFYKNMTFKNMRLEMSKNKNKLGLSCAKLSLASAKLYTSLSSHQLKLATNKLCSTLLTKLAEAL